MDISSLIYKSSQQTSTISTFHNNPFPRRPWITDTGAAAAVSHSGIKGIVAGKIHFFFIISFLVLMISFLICVQCFLLFIGIVL